MANGEVRDIAHRYNLWGGYRDEMVATAMTLSLLVIGSFIVTERLLPESMKNVKTNPSPIPQTLGAQDGQIKTTPQPTPKLPNPTPSNIELTEVAYGEDGTYDNAAYMIVFRNPVLQFDKKTNTKRKLLVTVWIKNKSAQTGLPLKLVGSIIKDGVILVPEVVLSVPPSKTVGPGEEITFDATLALIEGTDVRELKYKPGGELPTASHFLYP